MCIRDREDTCPHCGGRMVDILVLDGRDERLRFLGLDGILTATSVSYTHLHETGRVYDADLEDISQRQEQLWEGVEEILTQLSKLL